MPMILPRDSLITFGGTAAANRLSEHNRRALELTVERIERSVRTWNGTLRKYHIADKRSWSLNWEMLPGTNGKTVDGYWGALALQSFYNSNPGAFNMGIRNRAGTYDVYLVHFTDFSMTLNRRWQGDDWYDVSVSVEQI